MLSQGPERRKYLRAETPLSVRIITKNKVVQEIETKDISPIGMRFETKDPDININDLVELKIEIPGALCPVHAKAKVVWKKRLSRKDGSSFDDIGCEFTKIEEDNKNTFLKYFCDLLYGEV